MPGWIRARLEGCRRDLWPGAAVAGFCGLPLLACAPGALAVGAAGLFAAARRDGALSRRHHRPPAIARLAAAMAGVSRRRPGFGLGLGMLACTCPGLLADAGVLAACFGRSVLPVPWRDPVHNVPGDHTAHRANGRGQMPAPAHTRSPGPVRTACLRWHHLDTWHTSGAPRTAQK